MWAVALAAVAAAAAPAASVVALNVEVDASDIARRIVHTRVTLPAQPGENAFTYPKWIPGEHAPTGPIVGMVNVRFTVAGKPVSWRRDPIEMFELHVDAPPGTSTIEASFDFVTPTDGGELSGSTMGTENIGMVSFNQLLLVPRGMKSDDVVTKAQLTIPRGWDFASALPLAQRNGAHIDFAPASLTTLVDSPVALGRYVKKVAVGATPTKEELAAGAPLHTVDVIADAPAALEVPPDVVTEWGQLVAEAGALFGARHYRHYDFLLALSDHLEFYGLEHHESSDNRIAERGLTDDDKRGYYASLLPHEYAHSWNGKFRRPAGLATGDYATPMTGELLWVYEGLTEYLGMVLSARSGLESDDEWQAENAFWFAEMTRPGRQWRPLQDTATFAQDLYGAPAQWTAARRSVDFYTESSLLWLEVDTKIRALTGDKKSLDDFCRAFHGGAGGKPELKPYGFDDVVRALNDVAPYDWRSFWRTRLDGTTAEPPLAGLRAAGWDLGWTAEPSSFVKAHEDEHKQVNVRFSLGLVLGAEDFSVVDVDPGSPAFVAGVGPGMKVLGVNGRKISKETLDDALTASTKSKEPIELLVENADHYRLVHLDYHGGKRYPTLVRIDTVPDLLARILAPKTPHAARTADKKKPDAIGPRLR